MTSAVLNSGHSKDENPLGSKQSLGGCATNFTLNFNFGKSIHLMFLVKLQVL